MVRFRRYNAVNPAKHEEAAMRDRRIEGALICAAFLVLALYAFAGPKDFWETKPYTEWSAKEVEKLLLNKSPWTQTLLMVQMEGGGGSRRREGPNPGSPPSRLIINWYARPS